MEHYLSGEIDEVVVLYNHAKNAGEQVLIQQPLLPVNPKAFLPKGEVFVKGGGITEPTPDNPDLPGAIDYEPSEEGCFGSLPSRVYCRSFLLYAH